jgi:GT2 family glycosyltransferase
MKLSIGFITYNNNTLKYLPFFIPSLLSSINKACSSFSDLLVEVLIVDNSDNSFSGNNDFLIDFFNGKNVSFKIWRSKENYGFAKAYNLMINESIKNNSDIFLVINPDVLLEESFLKEMLLYYLSNKDIAVLIPKILYWDFKNNIKTNIIDSYGIGVNKGHRFFDINQGKKIEDCSKSNKNVFGFSGAGALFNLSKLIKIAYKNENGLEFFDEEMFMYKEDVDLSYRLQLFGEKIIFVPEAIMYHDRTIFKSNPLKLLFSKNRNLSRSRSFLNQLIILKKIKNIPFSLDIKIMTLVRFCLLYIYGFIFFRQQLRTLKNKNIEINKKAYNYTKNGENLRKIESFLRGIDF